MRTAPLAAMMALVVLAAGCTTLTSPGPRTAPGVPGTAGLVVSSSPLAAQAGASILRAGGSAADAAAAVQWALTVVEPQFSGIGGGAFLLVRNGTTGSATVFDGRERAPAATTPDQFQPPVPGDLSGVDHGTQGYAVGVPGTVKAFAALHAREGRLPWAQTFDPAIAHAEEGFVVDEELASWLLDGEERLRSWPASGRIYLRGAVCPPDAGVVAVPAGCAGGAPHAAGETLRNPDLGATLRLLAGQGPEALYGGPVAQAIALTTLQRQGRMTVADLAAYDVVEREPGRASYRGHEVLTAPSPAGGPILFEMLAMLEGFAPDPAGPHTAASLHPLIETMRLAYADRAAYNADPDVVPVPQRGLAHPAYAAERRALIDPDRRLGTVAAGNPWPHENATSPPPAPPRAVPDRRLDSHTTHFIVVDREGTIVSATTTIEAVWGTGMVVPGHGFLLNNELTDFDWEPGGPNEPGPAKRPRSSMVPTIVLEGGAPRLVVGAAGGPTITTSVLQVMRFVLDHGMGVEDAGAQPRIFGPWDVVMVQRGVPRETRDALVAMGHALEEVESISGLQAAAFEGGRWVGAPSNAGGAATADP